MKIIDLRSDTVTKPSKEMLAKMMEAEVGDDVYAEDPTVNLLQEKIAKLFGKEAALYVPSGTMSNQIAIRIITELGDEIIADADAHIYYYETAAPSILSGIQIRTVKSNDGMMDLSEIENLIRPDIYYFPKTRAIALENTHNRHGGTILSIEYIKSVKQLADKHNLKMHLDGARIWNASVASGIPLDEYGKYFDTISVCLSKGMGAPVGSLIVSNAENIKKSWKWRKIFGGGMRQAGILAAAGLYAIEHNLEKLISDHTNANTFALGLNQIDKINCNIDKVQTNIVAFEIDKSIKPNVFVEKCKEKGLLLSSIGGQFIRVVFHIDINFDDMNNALEIISNAMKEL